MTIAQKNGFLGSLGRGLFVALLVLLALATAPAALAVPGDSASGAGTSSHADIFAFTAIGGPGLTATGTMNVTNSDGIAVSATVLCLVISPAGDQAWVIGRITAATPFPGLEIGDGLIFMVQDTRPPGTGGDGFLYTLAAPGAVCTDFEEHPPHFLPPPPIVDGEIVVVGVDPDGDLIPNATDNCPTVANPTQQDTDSDAQGDACDADDDNDGVDDEGDNCPTTANVDQANSDSDKPGDACDTDDDGDGHPDGADNCPLAANPDQADSDADGLGDVCDPVPASTPGTASGAGSIIDPKHKFNFSVEFEEGSAPQGDVSYEDKDANLDFESTSLTTVQVIGTHVTIIGQGTVNGMAVEFRVDADDLGNPGKNDTFRIRWTGYDAGGVLRTGNIRIESASGAAAFAQIPT